MAMQGRLINVLFNKLHTILEIKSDILLVHIATLKEANVVQSIQIKIQINIIYLYCGNIVVHIKQTKYHSSEKNLILTNCFPI